LELDKTLLIWDLHLEGDEAEELGKPKKMLKGTFVSING
jgi:hypothetical protein